MRCFPLSRAGPSEQLTDYDGLREEVPVGTQPVAGYVSRKCRLTVWVSGHCSGIGRF